MVEWGLTRAVCFALLQANTEAHLGMTDGKTRLIVFSDDWGRHPSSSQHLVGRLLAEMPTVWVNTIGTRFPKLSVGDFLKVFTKVASWFMPRDHGTQLPDNLTVISPKMYPGFRKPWQRKFNANRMAKAVNAALGVRDPQGECRIAVTTLPITADLVGRIDVDRWVYYCVDDFAVWPGLDSQVMREMEGELLGKVDAIAAVSEHLIEQIEASGAATKPQLLTHGIDLGHWSAHLAEALQTGAAGAIERGGTLPQWWPSGCGPILLFWGLIDPRLDTEWCRAVAGQDLGHGECMLVLVGPEQNADPALRQLPGVVMPGAAAYELLPTLAAEADVLVMPYRDEAVTRAMQPLKFKEYLATGRPVVSRRLPATEPWQDAADLAQTAEGFADAVRQRLTLGMSMEQAIARKRLAGESWQNKAEQFKRVLLGEDDSEGSDERDRRSRPESGEGGSMA